ncbi:MAG: winged helix-turn-helix domain-containing protein [Nitrososphaeraceae archaeon]
MFTAYLSYEQLNEYLNGLLEKELLTCDSHTRTYNITPKGSIYVRNLMHSHEILVLVI